MTALIDCENALPPLSWKQIWPVMKRRPWYKVCKDKGYRDIFIFCKEKKDYSLRWVYLKWPIDSLVDIIHTTFTCTSHHHGGGWQPDQKAKKQETSEKESEKRPETRQKCHRDAGKHRSIRKVLKLSFK